VNAALVFVLCHSLAICTQPNVFVRTGIVEEAAGVDEGVETVDSKVLGRSVLRGGVR